MPVSIQEHHFQFINKAGATALRWMDASRMPGNQYGWSRKTKADSGSNGDHSEKQNIVVQETQGIKE